MAKAHIALEQKDQAAELLDKIIEEHPAFLDLNEVKRLREELKGKF